MQDEPSEPTGRISPISPKILWTVLALLATGLSILLLTGATESEMRQVKAEIGRLVERLDSLNKSNQELRAENEVLSRRLAGLDFPALATWRTGGTLVASAIVVRTDDSSGAKLILTPAEINFTGSPGITSIGAGAATFVQGKASIYLGAVGAGKGDDVEMAVRASSTGGRNDLTAELKAGPEKAWAKVGETARGSSVYEKLAQIQIDQNNANGGAWDRASNKSTTFTPGQFGLFRGGQPMVFADFATRGGRIGIFDEVGEKARISLNLSPENGEPGITVEGATKFGILYPNHERP